MMVTRWAPILLLCVCSVLGCSREKNSAAIPVTPATPMEQIGVPLYPGATQVSLEVGDPAPTTGAKPVSATYASTDSGEKIAAFYQEKLGLMVGGMPGVKVKQLVGKSPNGTFVQIMVNPDGKNSRIQYIFVMPAKPWGPIN